MSDTKRQLLFRPTDEQEEYLENNGCLISWTETVNNWIKHDRQKNKKLLVDKLRDGVLLVVMGVILFTITLFFSPSNITNIVVIIFLFSISAVSVTLGSVSILWEVYLYARK